MINQEEIKSQDDVVVNQGGRSSDVLVATIEKCEKLKKELESARWYQTAQNEDIGKLRGLLKECLPIVSAEIMTWQIRGGEESYKRGQDLLTRIKDALGESEEK